MKKHPDANCEECPLLKDGIGFAGSTIPESAQLLVVGIAPGFHEAAYGRPFVGPSGKLLRRVLEHYDYAPQEVGYTNLCLCRVRDNAVPPRTAVHACMPRLLAEIEKSEATDLLALGSEAAGALVAIPQKISTLRVGPPKEPSPALASRGVERIVPTWHPAYCLRSADAFPSMVSDIGKLRVSEERPWVTPRWTFAEEEDRALALIDEIDKATDVIVIDIEVGIDKETSFDHPNEYELLCIGVSYGHDDNIVFGQQSLSFQSVIDALKRLFLRKKLIAHNGKFDLQGLYPKFGPLTLWFDTMLASYCLDERPGNHGLKVLSVEKLGAPKYDDEIRQYVPRGGNYADIPRPILYQYNAMDVACTWDIFQLFVPKLERPFSEWPYPDREVKRLRDVHDFLVAAGNQLMFLELNGVKIDYPYNAELSTEYLSELETLEEQIVEAVREVTKDDRDFNPRSPKQIMALFEVVRVKADSTDKDTLEALLDRWSVTWPEAAFTQFLRLLLLHRRRQKLYGTFIKGIRRRAYRGRVYTTYMLHGSTSGRLASRNPNLQNIVRDKRIRRQFVASREDRVLVQADYKQAEGRVMTYLARDEYLRSIFSDPDQDLFNTLGCQLYRVDASQLDKENRIRVKAFFYGLSYGREAYSIAAEYGFSLSDTQRRLAEFRSLIPGIVAWQDDIKRQVVKKGRLITPFGRRRRFPLITDLNKREVFNEALSFLPQSTASDICLTALVRLRPLLRGIGWIRLTIHDALVAETSRENVEEVSHLLRTTMIQSALEFTDYVPFDVDVSIGDSWGDL